LSGSIAVRASTISGASAISEVRRRGSSSAITTRTKKVIDPRGTGSERSGAPQSGGKNLPPTPAEIPEGLGIPSRSDSLHEKAPRPSSARVLLSTSVRVALAWSRASLLRRRGFAMSAACQQARILRYERPSHFPPVSGSRSRISSFPIASSGKPKRCAG
jgi:hypothetical protein